MEKEERTKIPSLRNAEERQAFAAKRALERRTRYILPEGSEIRFIENPEKPYTGILVGYVALEEQKIPVVLGVVSQRGAPMIALTSLPMHSSEYIDLR